MSDVAQDQDHRRRRWWRRRRYRRRRRERTKDLLAQPPTSGCPFQDDPEAGGGFPARLTGPPLPTMRCSVGHRKRKRAVLPGQEHDIAAPPLLNTTEADSRPTFPRSVSSRIAPLPLFLFSLEYKIRYKSSSPCTETPVCVHSSNKKTIDERENNEDNIRRIEETKFDPLD